MRRLAVAVGLLAARAWLGPLPAAAQESIGEQSYQLGLYEQVTRGDLKAALSAYNRAVAAIGPGAAAVPALLRQAECLGWSDQPAAQRLVLSDLRNRTDTVAARLGVAAFLPSESNMVLQLDIAALLGSWLLSGWQVQLTEPGHQPSLEQLIAALGIDPRRDLQRLSLAAALSGDGDEQLKHWVVGLEGSFGNLRLDALETLIQAALRLAVGEKVELSLEHRAGARPLLRVDLTQPATAAPSAGRPAPRPVKRLLRMQGREVTLLRLEGDRPIEVGWIRLDDANLLIGDRRALARTLAALADRAAGLRANPRLWKIAGQLPERTDLWLMLSPDELVRQAQKVQSALGWGEILPDLLGFLVYVELEEQLRLTAVAFSSDEESTRTLADLARGGLAVLRIAAAGEEDPRLTRLTDGLRVNVHGERIEVVATVPGDLLQPPRPVGPRPLPPASPAPEAPAPKPPAPEPPAPEPPAPEPPAPEPPAP